MEPLGGRPSHYYSTDSCMVIVVAMVVASGCGQSFLVFMFKLQKVLLEDTGQHG